MHPDSPQAHARGKIMGGLVPPPIHASAADVSHSNLDTDAPELLVMFRGPTRWWQPGYRDVLGVLGWRWAVLFPALLVCVGIPVAGILVPEWRRTFIPVLFKVWLTASAVVVSIVLWAIRRVVRTRRDFFCIHCGYSIEGLASRGTCPECGHSFDRALTAEYRKDPMFFAHRVRAVKSAPTFTPFVAGTGKSAPDGTS